jgi:hypothetical protein
MDLAMVTGAQWHGVFIAHLAPERRTLCEAYVMGVGRLPAAELIGDEPDVKCVLDALSVGYHEFVLSARAAMRPCRGIVARAEFVELGHKSIPWLR